MNLTCSWNWAVEGVFTPMCSISLALRAPLSLAPCPPLSLPAHRMKVWATSQAIPDCIVCYAYKRMHTYARTHTDACTHAHKHTRTQTNTHTHICTRTETETHERAHTHTNALSSWLQVTSSVLLSHSFSRHSCLPLPSLCLVLLL